MSKSNGNTHEAQIRVLKRMFLLILGITLFPAFACASDSITDQCVCDELQRPIFHAKIINEPLHFQEKTANGQVVISRDSIFLNVDGFYYIYVQFTVQATTPSRLQLRYNDEILTDLYIPPTTGYTSYISSRVAYVKTGSIISLKFSGTAVIATATDSSFVGGFLLGIV